MQAWRGRIGDAGREPGARAHGHEGGIEQVAGRQAERNIGKPQRGRQPLAAAPADHLKALQGALGLGGHGKGQDVHHHQTAGDAQGIGLFQQLFHDGDALGGPDGQFRPLQGEQDEGRAEIAADRPQQLHAPGFAADGIDKEGARTVGQGTGDGLGIGRIQRQGHVHPGDQTLHQIGQEHGLVHQRGAHVHIKDAGPGLQLLIGQAEGLIELPGLQLAGQFLLARRIDALADDAERLPFSQAQELRTAGQADARRADHRTLVAGHAFQGLTQGRQMLGRGAAAAAQHPCPAGGEGRRFLGKGLRPQREDGLRAAQLRQTGIRFRDDGAGTDGQQLFHHGQHLIRPQTAVGAQGRHAHVLHGLGKDGGRRARQADALLESHGDHDGQVADLTRSRHGGPGFGQVELGLDEDEVRPAGHEAADLFREGLDEFLRLHITQRTGKMTARAHVAGYEDRTPGLGGRGARGLHHTLVERKNIQGGREFAGIAAERARSDDVHSCIEIGFVDTLKDIRSLHAELFRAHPGRQAGSLQHGPHGAIEQQRAPFRKALNKFHSCTQPL